MIELILSRDLFAADFTLGTLTCGGIRLGYTCEDTDRRLEEGGVKIPGRTAIPRGRYPVILSYSHRFSKVLPEVKNVPGFVGVRIHAGNTHENTEGCPLLGKFRTANGVRDCRVPNELLVSMLEKSEDDHDDVWLEVR